MTNPSTHAAMVRGPADDAGDGAAVLDATATLSESDRSWLADRAAGALAALGASGSLRVRLVSDAEMRQAHADYLGDPDTTDVITFDLADGGASRGEPLDVDLLVCLDEARRQGARRGTDTAREALLYIVHGVLHALGFNDTDEAAAAAMHAREDEVLTAIGVGPVFAPAGPLPS